MIIFGGLIGSVLTRFYDGEKNRRLFRCAVLAALDEIKKADGSALPGIYIDSVNSLRPEISRVMEDIWRWKRASFRAAWDSYCKEGELPLNAHYEERGRGKSAAWMLDHFEEGRNRLEESLNMLLKLAG